MIVWRLAAVIYAVAQGVGALNRARVTGYRRGFADGVVEGAGLAVGA